jgi:hypothetical protein
MVGFKGFGPNRIHGLEPVPESQSARHWSDLWKYMDTLPEFPTVLTDPLTGYMVRGFTKQNFNGHRFRKDNTFIEYNFDILYNQGMNGDLFVPTIPTLRGFQLGFNYSIKLTESFTARLNAGIAYIQILYMCQDYSPGDYNNCEYVNKEKESYAYWLSNPQWDPHILIPFGLSISYNF